MLVEARPPVQRHVSRVLMVAIVERLILFVLLMLVDAVEEADLGHVRQVYALGEGVSVKRVGHHEIWVVVLADQEIRRLIRRGIVSAIFVCSKESKSVLG